VAQHLMETEVVTPAGRRTSTLAPYESVRRIREVMVAIAHEERCPLPRKLCGYDGSSTALTNYPLRITYQAPNGDKYTLTYVGGSK
jgi:hypothetical protein